MSVYRAEWGSRGGGGREQASGIVDIFIVLERGERGRREKKEERNKIKG